VKINLRQIATAPTLNSSQHILKSCTFTTPIMGCTKKIPEMKSIKLFLFVVTTVVASALNAQTVDEIIAKHIDALGGKEKLGQLTSLYAESSMEVMGSSAPVKEFLIEGKGYKNEVEFNGSLIVNCVNDKGGWMINPMMGGTSATALPDQAYKAGRIQLYFTSGLHDYAAKGYKAELAGKEGNTYKIKLTDGGSETYFYIDAANYLLNKAQVKGEMMGQQVDITTTYADYKKTDFGVMMPYTKNVDMGMFQYTQKVDKVEVNKQIDQKIFEMPK
jgi:hypothetical protein